MSTDKDFMRDYANSDYIPEGFVLSSDGVYKAANTGWLATKICSKIVVTCFRTELLAGYVETDGGLHEYLKKSPARGFELRAIVGESMCVDMYLASASFGLSPKAISNFLSCSGVAVCEGKEEAVAEYLLASIKLVHEKMYQ